MPEQITRAHGYSDDLCEVHGVLSASLPCYHGDAEEWFVAFSDGTVLRLVYGDQGFWRLSRLAAGSCGYRNEPGRVEGGEPIHDVVTLTGPLSWVVLGDAMAAT